MRRYIGRRAAVDVVASVESTAGEEGALSPESDDFLALFVGEFGETAEEADARAEVAREVFAELMEEGAEDEISRLNAAYAAWLLCVGSMPWRADRGAGDVSRMEAAA